MPSKAPIPRPKINCFASITGMETSPLPDKSDINIIVIIYATGSLLPLSISKIGARPPFKFNLRERKIAKTDAASVEATTEPINIPSIQPMPNTRLQNTPTKPAVINVPTVDIKIEGAMTGFAVFQLVPNPPKNIIKTKPTEHTFFAIS